MRDRRPPWIWATAAVAAALGIGIGVAIVGREEGEPAPSAGTGPSPGGTSATGAADRPPGRSQDRDPAIGEGRRSSAERERRPRRVAVRRASRAYRSYVRAINERNGAAICAAIEPGFLAELRPPVRRGGCPDRIAASIGFADERGFPVWEETNLGGIESSTVSDGDGDVQLTAAIVTRFADRDEPSVESDVAYLLAGPGGYRLAKATGALWRAVGKPDVPPQAIAPPPGF